MTALTVADVLRRAAAEIDQRGWCQGANEDVAGRVCAIGAINSAISGTSSLPDVASADLAWDAYESLERQVGGGFISVWNDEPGRTADEVKAALLAAAEQAAES